MLTNCVCQLINKAVLTYFSTETFCEYITFEISNAGTCPTLCQGNGIYNGGICECYEGWKGRECELPSTQCEDPTCGNGNGKCVGGVCVCSPGYRGINCQEGNILVREFRLEFFLFSAYSWFIFQFLIFFVHHLFHFLYLSCFLVDADFLKRLFCYFF